MRFKHALIAAALAVAVFLPSVWIYYGLVRNRINRYGELENKAQREKARLRSRGPALQSSMDAGEIELF